MTTQPTLFDHAMHKNSLAAYRENGNKLGARALAIVANLKAWGASTDRNLAERMGFKDMNSVRPRVTELIKLNLVHEIGSTKCETTRKTVRIVDWKRE